MPDDIAVLAPATDNPAPVTEPKAVETAVPVATEPGPAAVVPPVETAAADVPPDWRDDWREKMAGGDEKELKRLQRFKSPVDVYKSARELERKMSAGEIKAKLADDASPEQVAAWRKDNGIPEKPDGYLEKLPKGLVIGEADKPLVDGFLAKLHGRNAPPEVVADALDWYYGAQEEMLAAQVEADKQYHAASTAALAAEWGRELGPNMKSVAAFLDAAPPADDGTPFKSLLMDARLGDGTRLGDNPAALKWLAGLAHDANPAGFVSPATGGQVESLESERAAMQQRMRSDPSWASDSKAHSRYEQVTNALSKMKA